MRFQRYPDGAIKWCWFIWGRHPKRSVTWTHSLSLSFYRPNTGIHFLRVIRPLRAESAQRHYGLGIGRLEIMLGRQDVMIRSTHRATDTFH